MNKIIKHEKRNHGVNSIIYDSMTCSWVRNHPGIGFINQYKNNNKNIIYLLIYH